MKNLILILALVLSFNSCNSKPDNSNLQTINPNDIQIGEVIHDSLTENQIHKIEKIQSTFYEVYPVSLEETLTNFKRDLNLDSEIEIWLEMAKAYENYLNSREGKLDLAEKVEVYKLILSRSMMPDEEAITNSKLTILTDNEAKKVLSFYTFDPDPIDVIKNN